MIRVLGRGPGYALVADSARPKLGSFTMAEEALVARQAAEQKRADEEKRRAIAQVLKDAEQYIADCAVARSERAHAAERAQIASKLAEGKAYLAERAAEHRRKADKEAADKLERDRQARAAAKSRADNATVNAFLKINSWRMTPAQASVQSAPIAAPVEPILSKHEITSLAEAERLARVAVQEALPRYRFDLFADCAAIEPATPFRIATKQTLKLT